MIKVGIIGAAGYTAGELLRILLQHPEAEVTWAQSESQAGKKVFEVHQDLIGDTDLTFTDQPEIDTADVLFLCKGHGASKQLLDAHPEWLNKKIIDLSQDFRIKAQHGFTYGLPELHHESIVQAKHIANPGCFATSIQLGLLPAVQGAHILGSISISGITGSTGAGQQLSPTSHFSWRSNNASVYKPLTHQHLLEVNQTFEWAQSGFQNTLHFIPYRGAFTRGIITTAHFETGSSEKQLIHDYEAFYQKAPFTHVVTSNPNLKQVVGTNKCLIYPKVIDGTAVVISVIDNLLKGAAGQAVQNMNLMWGMEEKTGLNLKSTAF